MAFKVVSSEYCAFDDNYRKEFVVDSDDDFEELPQCCAGSTAISPSGAVCIVNASGEWVPFGE